MKTRNHPGPRAAAADPQGGSGESDLPRRHQVFGWWALLVFLTLGLVLESLHGFKVPAYVRVSNETRRLMWTLGHAHGTLLALVNLAFASGLQAAAGWQRQSKVFASNTLIVASIFMPAGFLLGGAFIYSGDPGLGILLVPLGGILLFTTVLLTALAVTRSTHKP